jgi:COMPASS component SPP1
VYIDRPLGLDYLTPEEEEALQNIETKKLLIQKRIESYGLQFQLVKMVMDRRPTAINHPEVKEKNPCGYDNRLALNEHEFAYWMTTQEGRSAFETGKLGPRTEETLSLSTRQYSPEHLQPPPPLSETFNSVCLMSTKKCSRHRNWHKVHPDDCRHMTIVLKKELEKLRLQASEIIEDAEMREASKEYYAHNTVEQLF